VAPAPDGAAAKSGPRRFDGKVFENDFYRVTFDPKTGGRGGHHGQAARQGVVDASSPYKLGQLIYAAAARRPRARRSGNARIPTNQVSLAGAVAPGGGRGRPLFSSVRSVSPLHMFPGATMEVTLFEREPRIDFTYRLDKSHTFDKRRCTSRSRSRGRRRGSATRSAEAACGPTRTSSPVVPRLVQRAALGDGERGGPGGGVRRWNSRW